MKKLNIKIFRILVLMPILTAMLLNNAFANINFSYSTLAPSLTLNHIDSKRAWHQATHLLKQPWQSEIEIFEKELEQLAIKYNLQKHLNKNTKFTLHIGCDLRMETAGASKTHSIFNSAYFNAQKNILCLPYQMKDDTAQLEKIMRIFSHSKKFIGFDIEAPLKEKAEKYFIDAKWIGKKGFGLDFVFKNSTGDIFCGNELGDAWVSWYEEVGDSLKSKKVVILGAGPSGYTIASSLLNKSLDSLHITDINESRVSAAAETLTSLSSDKNVFSVQHESTVMKDAIRRADIIINATGIGKKYPEKSPLSDEMHSVIKPGAQAIDLNYRPKPINPFLEKAHKNGAVIFNGVGLLIEINAISAARVIFNNPLTQHADFETAAKNAATAITTYLEEEGLETNLNKLLGPLATEKQPELDAIIALVQQSI